MGWSADTFLLSSILMHDERSVQEKSLAYVSLRETFHTLVQRTPICDYDYLLPVRGRWGFLVSFLQSDYS